MKRADMTLEKVVDISLKIHDKNYYCDLLRLVSRGAAKAVCQLVLKTFTIS